MSKQCPHCGSQKFRANQKLYVDVIVDENNFFLSNDMTPDTELSIKEVDSPYGPYQCVGCDSVFDELNELIDLEEEQPPKPEPTHRASCHCNVVMTRNGSILQNDLIVGDHQNDVAKLAEERAIKLCMEIGCTDINDPYVLADFLDNGYLEYGGTTVMISWPCVTESDL